MITLSIAVTHNSNPDHLAKAIAIAQAAAKAAGLPDGINVTVERGGTNGDKNAAWKAHEIGALGMAKLPGLIGDKRMPATYLGKLGKATRKDVTDAEWIAWTASVLLERAVALKLTTAEIAMLGPYASGETVAEVSPVASGEDIPDGEEL